MTLANLHGLVRLSPFPDTLYTSRSRTVLATSLEGVIPSGSRFGLYVHQTRLLSRYEYFIDGKRPRAVSMSNVEQHRWLGYYIVQAPGVHPGEEDKGSGRVPHDAQLTLELRASRHVSYGLHEDLDLTNWTQQPIAFTFELALDADFAAEEEAAGSRLQHGALERSSRVLSQNAVSLAFEYRAEHAYDHTGHKGVAGTSRSVEIRIESSFGPLTATAAGLALTLGLEPRQTWHACLSVMPDIDGERHPELAGCPLARAGPDEYERRRSIFVSGATRIRIASAGSLSTIVHGALETAKDDLAALRFYDLDEGETAWTVAAGLPIYTALFGRDTLTASWQAALLTRDIMRGTLPVLARLQGTRVDDWRDEQPGRMLHEAHTSPIVKLRFDPRERYYGSITTSGFYPVAVSELWHWTGDKEAVRPFVGPALKALQWLDEYCDRDGDGFYEYERRSEQGTTNQAWKDSNDAIVYEDGSQVTAPIATCEEQGFVYLAKLHLSELLWWLGEKEQARRLFHQAGELKKRFSEAFWMEPECFVALGLDSAGRQIRSIGSNPGHCLATAILDHERAAATARRLFEPDLFSGWGIRTLSSLHPAYNPYSYHRGSVWPVENGTFALALMRYGLHDEVERLCRAQFEAAALFDGLRLPEVFSGHPRDELHPFPALYPRANSPQAWSASAVFCFVQAMLGLYPYAPLRLLLVDPHLPDWLPDVTLSNLRVGEASVTIRFFRTPGGSTDYSVLDKQGTLHVVNQPSPWSLTATFAERLRDALASLVR